MVRDSVRLSFGATLAILWPYVRENLAEQIRSISFIVVYLVFFQIEDEKISDSISTFPPPRQAVDCSWWWAAWSAP